MTHPEAIIFDLDGLLVDSEPVWEEAESGVFLSHGIYVEHHVREQLVGLRNDEYINRIRQTYNVPIRLEILQGEIIGAMLDIIPKKVKAKAGAAEILAYAHQHQIPIAIASSSPVAIIEAIVKSQGWESRVPVRCSAETVAKGKPAPDVYLEAAQQLRIAPDKCLAMEDSPNGARAAVAAGMTCYAVPDLAHTRIEAFDGITPHVYESLHSVLEQLMVS
jgi:mannitol-1-/sugar-/sorbitol-6-/2-deoxyglucose-6-phosphatase